MSPTNSIALLAWWTRDKLTWRMWQSTSHDPLGGPFGVLNNGQLRVPTSPRRGRVAGSPRTRTRDVPIPATCRCLTIYVYVMLLYVWRTEVLLCHLAFVILLVCVLCQLNKFYVACKLEGTIYVRVERLCLDVICVVVVHPGSSELV